MVRKLKKPGLSRIKLVMIASIALVIIAIGVFYFTEAQPFGLNIWEAYQNVANPYIRTIKIIPGMRKEQVADRFGKVLGWSDVQKEDLIKIHTLATYNNSEGYYFPDTYVVPAKATPAQISKIILDRFNEKIVANVDKQHSKVINLDTAIKIASIIEREAGRKSDMKIISGVIWNRLFQGMALDMDSTSQYPIGTENNWWPKVTPNDLKTDTPYNTYVYKGFPPSAISNPSEDAIWAAFNPAKTDVVFFIHDNNGIIHTAVTYKQHLENINTYY